MILLSFTELRFHEGRTVINSLAFEFIQIAKRRLIVLRTGGYDDGARRETVPVVQNQLEGPPCAFPASAFRLCGIVENFVPTGSASGSH